jgi:hypothetical protein
MSTLSSSQNSGSPTPLLALTALDIVSNFDRTWIVGSLKERWAQMGVSPFRVSRLKASLLPGFESALLQATRRGPRPFCP